MRMNDFIPKPTPEVAARIEELLREQLLDMGERVSGLDPGQIAEHMFCELHEDGSLTYAWKGQPILHVLPEVLDDEPGHVIWRMFTKEDE